MRLSVWWSSNQEPYNSNRNAFIHQVTLPKKTAIQKMNSKDKAFLEKFCAEESGNLTGFENCRGTGFFIIAWFGWYSPYQSKIDQIFTHQSPPSKFYILMKALLPLLLLEMEHLSLKTKSCHKIFNNKMSQRFLGNLEKILPVVNIFYKDLQFMAMKVSCMQKI